jgi:hypothetical protein
MEVLSLRDCDINDRQGVLGLAHFYWTKAFSAESLFKKFFLKKKNFVLASTWKD